MDKNKTKQNKKTTALQEAMDKEFHYWILSNIQKPEGLFYLKPLRGYFTN